MKFDDIYFMNQALNIAKLATKEGEVPVGAVIVIDNKIIARAHNLTEKLHDVTAHAEMLAITSASNFLNGKFLKGCTIYVTLEPCVMCTGALCLSQINRLVIGASDLKMGGISKGIKLHPKTKIKKGVLQEESTNLIQEFFVKKRTKN